MISLADEFGGKTNLRFDDTNPEKEEQEYVDSIQRATCIGSATTGRPLLRLRLFRPALRLGVKLIKDGKAYVDDLTADQVREYRGTLTEPGKESPYRNRSMEENLDLFIRMKNGEFPDGARTLRAKIDMSSPNMNMRDPIMYRILRASIIGPATSGHLPDLRLTRTDSRIRSRRLRTRCARSSSPITSRFTAGTSSNLGIFRRSRLSSIDSRYLHATREAQAATAGEDARVSGWNDPRMPTLGVCVVVDILRNAIRNFVGL